MARYLQLVDRYLPGRVSGLYVVGSAALGAWRPERIDIDLIVMVDGNLSTAELRKVRAVQVRSGARAGAGAVVRGRVALPGTCNGTYVSVGQLSRPVTEIRPLVSHVGWHFGPGHGFDVNPVVWKTFQERGVAFRGPHPAELALDPEPEKLRAWNLGNLNRYWKPWAETAERTGRPMGRFAPSGWVSAWGVLGAPRLHCTMTTGEVISKEEAGRYALDAFGPRWQRLIREALAYWRSESVESAFTSGRLRTQMAGRFVAHVVSSANAL